MKLSKQTTDAIEILVSCVRSNDNLLKVGDVAVELGLSKQMALKLAYILNQAGFLEAVRGPKGGIRLTSAARNAKLGEIVRELELQPFSGNGGGDSLFGGYVDEAFEAFLSVLDQHTLADLAARADSRSPKLPAEKRVSRKRTKSVTVSGATARRSTPAGGRTAAV